MEGVGTNRYAYAGNDPVNKFDPNGHNAAVAEAVLTAEEVVKALLADAARTTAKAAAIAAAAPVIIGGAIVIATTGKVADGECRRYVNED